MVTISQLKLLSRGVYSNPRRKSKMGCFLLIKYDALRDLVPFVQFKKREKTPMEERYF